ncbi:hypothetical protein MKW98_005657 [Papaver atlanticum]|uniref:Uncharacterized protein n=1 Tax=Papaver atlanticum TaxID=357466 RepID=A0AAD4SUL0_9MAGN|nr:hypothetical protein MKW98_005657 [Papaver atlanticum]
MKILIENRERIEEEDQMGFPIIHNQVKKIKQEYEKFIQDHPSPDSTTSSAHSETRPVFREITRQLSRSPLGRNSCQPISVGDS